MAACKAACKSYGCYVQTQAYTDGYKPSRKRKRASLASTSAQAVYLSEKPTIISHESTLLPLCKGKSSLKRIVGRLKILHHGVPQTQPTMSNNHTLGLIPGEITVFQQRHCNLIPLNIVSQPNKVKVSVELVYEPTHAHPIHRAFEVVGQTRLDRQWRTLCCRLDRLSRLSC